MNNLVSSYIAKSVLMATGTVLAVLIGVESFIEFLGELPDLGAKHYDIMQALGYVAMQMP